jgi:hypothetical protein
MLTPGQHRNLQPAQLCCPNQKLLRDLRCYPMKGGLSFIGPQSPPPYRPEAITGTQETPRSLSSSGASPAKRTDSEKVCPFTRHLSVSKGIKVLSFPSAFVSSSNHNQLASVAPLDATPSGRELPSPCLPTRRVPTRVETTTRLQTRLREFAPTEVVFHTPLQTFLTFYLARTAFTDQRTTPCCHTQRRPSSAPLCSCSGARRKGPHHRTTKIPIATHGTSGTALVGTVCSRVALGWLLDVAPFPSHRDGHGC